MTSPKTKLKDCGLNDREYNIAAWGNSMRYKINSGRQFNELKNKINEQKECFTKEFETIKENQTNSRAEECNKWDEYNKSIANRADQMEERINKLEIEI